MDRAGSITPLAHTRPASVNAPSPPQSLDLLVSERALFAQSCARKTPSFCAMHTLSSAFLLATSRSLRALAGGSTSRLRALTGRSWAAYMRSWAVRATWK